MTNLMQGITPHSLCHLQDLNAWTLIGMYAGWVVTSEEMDDLSAAAEAGLGFLIYDKRAIITMDHDDRTPVHHCDHHLCHQRLIRASS